MKKTISYLSAFLILIVIANAQPFGPPLYIGNKDTMECRYYFSGDEKHFNERPKNFTENIGFTTDFKSESQACEFFRCVITNGTVKVNPDNSIFEKDLCICSKGLIWNNLTGCVQIEDKIQNNIKKNIFHRIIDWINLVF